MAVNHVYAIALSNLSTPEKPTWAISIQPKKNKRLFWHESPHTVVLQGNEKGTTVSNDDLHNKDLLVKMLIGENSIANIGKSASQTLHPITSPTNSNSLDWLKTAVTALQSSGLINHFNIETFTQMAEQTLRSQQEHHETVAVEVDFLGELGRTRSVEEMHESRDKALEKKGKGETEKSYFGFRVSRPQGVPKRVRQVESWERKDDPYGGMM